MKKKGLIISTVVMVVVLIASLTTATYAWFTVSNKTTISGFNLSVVAGNAVNIGVKKDNEHKVKATNDDFLSGDVTWTNKTNSGQIGKDAGAWSGGTAGLSSTLTHNINWGEQSKAVGAFNAESYSAESDSKKYGYIGDTKTVVSSGNNYTGMGNTASGNQNTFLNAANLGTGTTLASITPAYANKGTEEGSKGDYAYLFLGAAPAEELVNNTLVLVLDGSSSTGTNVGMLAAVHVAYRVTKAGAENVTTKWTEAQFFECGYDASLQSQSVTWTAAESKAYETAYTNSTAPTTKVGVVKIDGLSIAQGAIDQIELIIYIAGSDPDCIDNAKNASGEIKMFFATESATASDKPASATIDNTGKLTLTGAGADTIIQYRTKSGESWGKEVAFNGTWSTTTYTVDAVGDALKDATIQVRQKAPGKAWSDWADVENNFKTA